MMKTTQLVAFGPVACAIVFSTFPIPSIADINVCVENGVKIFRSYPCKGGVSPKTTYRSFVPERATPSTRKYIQRKDIYGQVPRQSMQPILQGRQGGNNFIGAHAESSIRLGGNGAVGMGDPAEMSIRPSSQGGMVTGGPLSGSIMPGGAGGMVIGGPLGGSILPGHEGGMVVGGPAAGSIWPGSQGGMVIGGPLGGSIVPGSEGGMVIGGPMGGSIMPGRQ